MKITVTVKPNSKKGPLVVMGEGGELTVYVKEVAADGKANAAVITLLAKHYSVAKSHITIKSGHTSKHKIIELLAEQG